MSLTISHNPDGTITISCSGQSVTIGAPPAPVVATPQPLPPLIPVVVTPPVLPPPVIIRVAKPTVMEKSKQDFSDMLDGIEISAGSGKILGSLTTQPDQTIDFIEMFQDAQQQLKPTDSFIVTLRGSDDG